MFNYFASFCSYCPYWKQLFSCFVLFFLWNTTNAQSPLFYHLSNENGLSQNAVLTITQDQQGFMWFGTDYGLNRYDGYQFQQFQHDKNDTTSISDNYIKVLFTDSKARLWIANTKGLNLYRPQTQSFSRVKLPNSENTKFYIRSIYEDLSNNLWVVGEQGLYVTDGKKINFKKLTLPHGLASAIYQADNKQYYIGTNKGLYIADYNKGQFRVLKYFQSNSAVNSLSDNAISDILQDKQGQVWIATDNGGLNLYQNQTKDFKRFSISQNLSNNLVHDNIRKLLLRKDGTIWIGTQEGLSVLDPVTKLFKNYTSNSKKTYSLNQNSIYALFEDRVGSVWLGTFFGGINVNYAFPSYFHVWHFGAFSSSMNVISTIIPDGENYWIGTEGNGLGLLNKNGNILKTYSNNKNIPMSLGSNLVKTVYRDKNDNIWVGTHGGGLNLLNKTANNFKQIKLNSKNLPDSRLEVVTLLEDNKKQFWVGTQVGLFLFGKDNHTLTPIKLPPYLKSLENIFIKVLYQDSAERIWIGTSKGVYCLKNDKETLSYYDFTAIKPDFFDNNKNAVNCISEDKEGNIWLGLSHAGIAVFNNKTQKFDTFYTHKDGLSDDDVAAIIADKIRNIWISTANGLSKFDTQTKKFNNFTRADGIAADKFNYNSAAFNSNDELMFGGFEGLTVFNPHEIEENKNREKIVFTKLFLLNDEVKIGDNTKLLDKDLIYSPKITFSSQQNVFSFQFALLNYIKPSKNTYAYMLKGVNEHWISTATPKVSYANLPSGNYTLMVKGANNDGYWSEPVTLQFEVLPPFYKSWWAFVSYTFILTSMIFVVVRYFYVRGKLVKEEELHQMKLNFFTNISHEIRTHLTLITVPIDRLIDENSKSSKLLKQLVPVKNQASRLLSLVTELMDFRKAESDELPIHSKKQAVLPLLQELIDAFEIAAQNNQIDFQLIFAKEHLMCCFDEVQLEKVLFNLLSNAFKFTPNKGKITIEVNADKEFVSIAIIDNGRGIAPQYLDKLFDNFFQVDDFNSQQTGYGVGLALSKRIVELHQGKITVSSKLSNDRQNNQTQFAIYLPINCQEKTSNSVSQPVVVTTDELNQVDYLLEDENVQKEHLPKSEERILIVEDNPLLRSLLHDILIEYYQVILAENGLVGLQLAQSELPDLILSDVMMPKMSGTELCYQIKTEDRTNHIPVILLTAKNKLNDELQGLQDGADVYLTKPFSKAVLLLQIRNQLKTRMLLREKYNQQFLLEPNEPALESRDGKFLNKLIAIIEINMEKEIFAVDNLASEIGMSYSVLNKKLKSLMNMSVNDFSKSIRLKRAAQLLQRNEFNIAEVAYMVGFSDRKYFSKEFKKLFGKNPSEYIEDTNE